MHPLRYARAGSIYEDGSNRVYALINKNEGICELLTPRAENSPALASFARRVASIM
jgi:hypothetical protein